jgi:hypothetical protein
MRGFRALARNPLCLRVKEQGVSLRIASFDGTLKVDFKTARLYNENRLQPYLRKIIGKIFAKRLETQEVFVGVTIRSYQ